ncbi:hypothetical protein MN116_005368 [Schistosoma mekongi]|uniref:Mitochondria-eating protein n=1 Tax=Schistosoma mekongi TaxID=38744 RepID=A0AAE1ZDP6_SCHME|nr:hypothetical protein MN116_005368 [Schistosoma mekongi]
MNTCDENVAMGCEIIELNARIQNQLFRLISICASEGGPYGGTNAIKLRLLPLLGNGIMSSNFPFGSQTVNPNSFLPKTYESEFLKYPRQGKTEFDLIETRRENNRLRDQILSLEGENERLKSQICYPVKSDYDMNKDNTSSLKGLPNSSKIRYITGLHTFLSPIYTHTHTYSSIMIIQYYISIECLQYNILFRFHSSQFVFSLKVFPMFFFNYLDNSSIFISLFKDSFHVAKSHFRTYKNRVRKQIATNNLISTETLDELVQSHINIHASHSVDLSLLVKDVCLALERRVPRIRRPSQNIGFELIKDFLYETCKLAWECAALSHPLEVCKPTCENELIDETKYRRSHDSSYPTLLIHHYIWPCLMQNERVLAKGEVCTRGNLSTHGYEMMSMDNRKGIDRYRNRLSSRSCSPVRPSTSPGK